MPVYPKRNSFLGLLAGRMLSLFGKSLPPPTTEDFKKMEFKTSTQRMGVRFTENIRRIFRFRWIRKI